MTSIDDENLSVTRSLNSSWWETLRRLRKFPPSSRRQRCFRCGELCPVGPSRETGKTTRLLPLHQRPGRLPWRRSGSLPQSLPCRIIFLHYFNGFNRNVRDLPFFFFWSSNTRNTARKPYLALHKSSGIMFSVRLQPVCGGLLEAQ